MKQTAKLFYSIGFIFNILGILVFAIFLALLCVSYNAADIIAKVAQDTQETEELVKNIILLIIIIFAIIIALHITSILLVIFARGNLAKKTGIVFPHVIILVMGLLDFNFLYLLGGIFGCVAASKDNDLDDEDDE